MNHELSLFDLDPVEAAEWPDRPRMLLSYAYAAKLVAEDFAELDHADLIIDSGAFTAQSSGKPVVHDEYLAWLLEHASSARFAFSLDVIGDPDASMVNYHHGREVLAAAGSTIQLVPAWHIGSPWSVLDTYCQLTDYVAIGGAVPFARMPQQLYRLCRHAHDIASARGARLHGLGITGRRVMYQLPWSSVDSSSWNMFGRFAAFTLSDVRGRLTALNYGLGKDQDLTPELYALARVYGLDPTRMHEPGYGAKGWATQEENLALRAQNRQASARSFMYAEVVKRQAHPAFRLYLACDASDTREIRMVNAAHKLGNPWVPAVATPTTTTTTTKEVA